MTIPSMEDAQEDASKLASITMSREGLQQALGILKKYEEAINATPGLLPEGQKACDVFNIIGNLESKLTSKTKKGGWTHDNSIFAAIPEGGAALKMSFISGVMHMMTSLLAKNIEVSGHEGREVVDACEEEDAVIMSSVKIMSNKKLLEQLKPVDKQELIDDCKDKITTHIKIGIDKMIVASQNKNAADKIAAVIQTGGAAAAAGAVCSSTLLPPPLLSHPEQSRGI